MDADFLRREADRLLNDVVLAEALSRIRSQAVERLLKTDPADTTQITRQQAIAAVCDTMQAELASMVASASPRKPIKAI